MTAMQCSRLKFKQMILRIEKTGDLGDFKHGMVVGASQIGLRILEIADLLGFSWMFTWIVSFSSLWENASGQRRRKMARLV